MLARPGHQEGNGWSHLGEYVLWRGRHTSVACLFPCLEQSPSQGFFFSFQNAILTFCFLQDAMSRASIRVHRANSAPRLFRLLLLPRNAAAEKSEWGGPTSKRLVACGRWCHMLARMDEDYDGRCRLSSFERRPDIATWFLVSPSLHAWHASDSQKLAAIEAPSTNGFAQGKGSSSSPHTQVPPAELPALPRDRRCAIKER
ncbi:hypothetical protein IE81DRAFT_226605 [Ceraceosorus guamensis]|uniref:Uncharacterized protein n=1 Tax=Ceraceosorus guamensis TaxID=1522189 RepID=A0A316W575_9BASI|nr:hypothetical protein IE81DRAFT_226605 [Ceraceosorus guamensis]PWN45037.1 hypothetical protein IE81DRAFT_226605 [Ceraceosorus guamensis]